jgi:molecular chaperone GrpE
MMSDETPATEASADCAELQAENAALRDRLLRALADAENTRRRADRASAEARQSAVADFARELLAVADNLQRALAAVGEEARRGEGSLIEGVEVTRRLLTLAFERFGVRPIEALGKRFDPALHEAVAMEESADAPGTVVGVVEDGYTINGRLLRPARVVVAKARPNAASPSIAPEPQGETKVNERRT